MFVNLQKGSKKSQIKVSTTLSGVSKDSVPSNLSISNFHRKWLLWNEFSDLLTSYVTDEGLDYLSESLKGHNPSISTLASKEFCSMNEFFDLLIVAKKSQMKFWTPSAKA